MIGAYQDADVDVAFDLYFNKPNNVPDDPLPTPEPPRASTSPIERVGALRRAQPGDLQPTPVATVKAVLAREADAMQEALDDFAVQARRALDETSDGKLRVNGSDTEINLSDKITIPARDGNGTRTITVRDMLKEQEEARLELEAVSACSLRKTS